jgi:hypothetical protein
MPAGYEKLRDKFIKQGMSRKAAQRKAAKIWNEKNKNNPVTRKHSDFEAEDPLIIIEIFGDRSVLGDS